jgi:proteasome lid subunit RPN8/RPN11
MNTVLQSDNCGKEFLYTMSSTLKFDIKRFYEKDKEGLTIAEAAISEIQKLEAVSPISKGTGEMGWRGRNGGVRTLGIGISTEFIKKGYINLRGNEVNSPQQLAVLAQVYRDPRFETIRFIYMKGNIIVGHEGITSKLPAASVAFLNIPTRENYKDENEYTMKRKTAQAKYFMNMLHRMEKLEADGYFLLHNHPSGINVNPSKEDINLTIAYQSVLSGFRGHVIINSNKYSYIDENLWVSVNSLDLGKDKLLVPSLPHPLLGESIDSSSKLATLAKSIQIDPNYSVVMYINSRNDIRAIQEVPDGLFNHEKECVNFLRGRMTEFGTSRAFVATRNEKVKAMATSMVSKGYLLDAIVANKDYSITSVRESGVCPSLSSDIYWMGRNINKGAKVSEKSTDYTTQQKSCLNILKVDKSQLHNIGI